MEGVPAAAREFLSDGAAVEAYLEVDRRREAALHELHDAFISFRDADESIHRLVKRIRQPLWEVRTPPGGGAPVNLWGFQHEDERLFAERFAGAAPRVPDVALASRFRSDRQAEPRRAADPRVPRRLRRVRGRPRRARRGGRAASGRRPGGQLPHLRLALPEHGRRAGVPLRPTARDQGARRRGRLGRRAGPGTSSAGSPRSSP
ncbi:MAG: hypothetical protein KIT58_13750 [Planctomycetota bacterium]|nr:hypothetical protein [Planctomycetota bacterium]